MHIVGVTSMFPELPLFLQPVDTIGQKGETWKAMWSNSMLSHSSWPLPSRPPIGGRGGTTAAHDKTLPKSLREQSESTFSAEKRPAARRT